MKTSETKLERALRKSTKPQKKAKRGNGKKAQPSRGNGQKAQSSDRCRPGMTLKVQPSPAPEDHCARDGL